MSSRMSPAEAAAEMIVAMGCTQVGKSTTIASLTVDGEHKPGIARPEDGGESCTVMANVYRTRLGMLLDTPGWLDTRARWSDEQWADMISLAAVGQGARRLKVIIFECLSNSNRAVRNNVERLVKALGREVLPSTVIVCTMLDKVDPEERELKLGAVRRAAEGCGIRQIVLWQNKKIDNQGRMEQERRLGEALRSVEGAVPERLRTRRQQVEELAKQLCENQKRYERVEKLSWQETQAVPRTEKETYDQVYIETEKQKRRYLGLKAVEKTVKVPEVYQVERGGIPGWFGMTRPEIRMVNSTDTTYVPEERQCEELVPVARTRQATREVTKYDEKKIDRSEDRTVLSTERPWQDFIPQAAHEISEKIRKEIASACQ
eukprot:TRINITY_DN65694_c0_g1_i1.p2 TRINITY_DN65694_c0_g1~~TRINITY_DN65694_c0_g1_i1.p2  ORF type:complete len:375 (+),score=94.72 TRINITY_DN65694_c0_g1_i1:84-1208(+)